VLGALAALPGSSSAQEGVGSAAPTAPTATASPSSTTRDAAALAEEIVVLRAVKPLNATREQLAVLTTAVTQAQERLAQQAQADWRALAALRDPAARARQQLLPENVDLNNPQVAAALLAEQQVANARRAAEQNQARVRDEQSASLRKQLETLLTPAQVAAIVTQGRAMLAAERAQQDQQREAQRQQFEQRMRATGQTPGARGGPGATGGPGGPGGGRGGRGGGPGVRGPERMLEQLRSADADQYQRMSRGIARRFGDEGTPAYQNALAMFDRIRSMPDGQFRRQRADLMQQFSTGMAITRSPANAAGTISAERAAEAWIERYLLSPRALAALQGLSTIAEARS
jgi:hypothetical protein